MANISILIDKCNKCGSDWNVLHDFNAKFVNGQPVVAYRTQCLDCDVVTDEKNLKI